MPWYVSGDPADKGNLLKHSQNQWDTRYSEDLERPMMNVSWFGARAYCQHYGKSLPRVDEWIAAGTSTPDRPFPWGDTLGAQRVGLGHADRQWPFAVGKYDADRSRIGCFDLAGNVAEWCDEFADQARGEREVRGGDWKQDAAGYPGLSHRRQQPQVAHAPWLGFRGVLRIPVDE